MPGGIGARGRHLRGGSGILIDDVLIAGVVRGRDWRALLCLSGVAAEGRAISSDFSCVTTNSPFLLWLSMASRIAKVSPHVAPAPGRYRRGRATSDI